jgi:hypothetical protein
MEQKFVRNTQTKITFSLLSLPTNSFNFFLSRSSQTKQNYTLSITSSNLKTAYPILPTLLAFVPISCLILSKRKITIIIQYGYLQAMGSLIKLHFITEMITKVAVRQNGTRICQKYSNKYHTFSSLSAN